MSLNRVAEILRSIVIAAACLNFTNPASTALANSDTNEHGIVVTETENGGRIDISKGAALTIRLETVPGTGHSWKLVKSDTAKLKLVKEDLEIAARSMPGSLAHNIFRFMAEQPGTSTVELHYVRPWEKEASPRKTYKIEVHTK